MNYEFPLMQRRWLIVHMPNENWHFFLRFDVTLRLKCFSCYKLKTPQQPVNASFNFGWDSSVGRLVFPVIVEASREVTQYLCELLSVPCACLISSNFNLRFLTRYNNRIALYRYISSVQRWWFSSSFVCTSSSFVRFLVHLLLMVSPISSVFPSSYNRNKCLWLCFRMSTVLSLG